jgi:hypothetical protein
MFCRNCGNQLAPGAAVCLSCGAPVSAGGANCGNCGATIPPAAAVCLRCGSAVGGGRSTGAKPGKVQVIAIFTLISGILNLLNSLAIIGYGLLAGLTTFGIGCLLWLLAPLPIVIGAMEIAYATKILPDPIKASRPGTATAIMEIVGIICCNVISCAAGITALVLYSDPEVKEYFSRQGGSA